MLKIAVFFTCVFVVIAIPGPRPVVKTNYGKIRGHIMKSYSGRDFFAFNGIPYAKPPIGDLRFKAPVSPSKYDGVLDGSEDAEDCFQIDLKYNKYSLDSDSVYGVNNGTKKYVGSEDCLYLNVYTPRLTGKKLPVMVFIHAGSFKFGSGSMLLQGPQFFLDHDVILVTINYRLEILGFLRADDVYMPGNIGLKDQSAALRWVKENIESFNGDPETLTIFGESAGSAGVNFQLLAPRNKGVVQRAISHSGYAYCAWAIGSREKAKKNAITLATTVGCPTEPQMMLKCLQEKSVLEIYQAFSSFATDVTHHMDFKPVLENYVPGAFITERSFAKGSDVPWIIGVTSEEGVLFLGEWITDRDADLSLLNQTYLNVFPTMFYMTTWPGANEVARKVKQFYLGDNDFSMDNILAVSNIFSDTMITHGYHQAGQKHRGKLYRFFYSHVGERTFAQSLQRLNLGVSHGDEMHVIFYSTRHFKENPKLNDADDKVSKRIIKMWINFAKYGDPTPEGSEIKWPESSENTKYLEISSGDLKIGSDLFKERMQFWDEIYRTYQPAKEKL